MPWNKPYSTTDFIVLDCLASLASQSLADKLSFGIMSKKETVNGLELDFHFHCALLVKGVITQCVKSISTTFKEIEKNSILQWENLQSHLIRHNVQGILVRILFFPKSLFHVFSENTSITLSKDFIGWFIRVISSFNILCHLKLMSMQRPKNMPWFYHKQTFSESTKWSHRLIGPNLSLE